MPQCSVDKLIDPLEWKRFCSGAHCVTTCSKTRLLLDLRCILCLKRTDMRAHFPWSASARALPEASLRAGTATFAARRHAAGGPHVQGVCVSCATRVSAGSLCCFSVVFLEMLLSCQLVAC